MFTRRQFKKLSFLSLLYSLKGCASWNQTDLDFDVSSEKSDLYILWERGYLPEENQGILQLVEEWQHLAGQNINLKLVSDDFIEQELMKLLKDSHSASTPDIVFSITFNQTIAPILAWQDKLLDLSDLIKPIESSFHADTLTQVRYRNQVRDDRRYYALPIGQADAYLHYWKNLLADIGYAETDIPKQWDGFWEFWKTAQTELRSRHHSKVYGLGLCLSANGFDTPAAFQLFLDAHNVAIATQEQKLVLTEARNRERFIHVITELADFYREGYVPPDALEWTGSGNNVSFLNQRSLMTLNMTLSIPMSQKLEHSLYNQRAAQRYHNIGTLAAYPQKLDGTILYPPRILSQILVPKHNRPSKKTLDFLQFLLKLENLRRLIQGFDGRILPTIKPLINDPFWQDLSDPNIVTALAIYNQPRSSEDEKLHPILSEINLQQLWAQIIHRALQKNTSSTQAADWGIQKIQEIWKTFESTL